MDSFRVAKPVIIVCPLTAKKKGNIPVRAGSVCLVDHVDDPCVSAIAIVEIELPVEREQLLQQLGVIFF